MGKLQKLAIDAYCWLFCVQARFLAWQVEHIARKCPVINTDLTTIECLSKTYQLPREVGIAISRLVVARRRGISG